MSNKTTKVHLTLRTHVAARLLAMCHARGLTASEIIDGWIFSADDQGNQKAKPTAPNPFAGADSTDFFKDLFGQRKK